MSSRMLRPICVALAAATVWCSPAWSQVPGKPKKIAHFHMSGTVTETPQEDPFGMSGGHITSMKDLLERLSDARKDESVRAVIMTFGDMSPGLAQIEELREEIKKFKAVDKRVFVHIESLTMGSYALLSAATDLSVVPTSDLWLTGLYGEQIYVKSLLDKIGCSADIIHIGDFKSAGEMFTNTEPSAAARENLNWLLDGLYEGAVAMMAESRGQTPEKVKGLIDNGPYTAEKALAAGLVDSVKHRDDFVADVVKAYGEDVTVDNRYGEKGGLDIDMSNPFAFFSVFTELFGGKKKKAHDDSIGIVYVEGMIVTGHAQPSPFGGSSGAYSGDIRKALEEAADDDSVKAVVLRVDSPGGSALASEIIWHATQQVQARKPLIVSMGNVAGSGGYYVACGAKAIYADANTITGSIGVVGGKFVTTGMWDKLGVNWVPFKRGKNADLMNSAGPFDQDQRNRIKGWMEDVYKVFTDHVAKGREGKLKKPMDQLAGGRVYTGKQALELGLVDKIGGMSDAIEFAARTAGITDYDVRVIPEPQNFIDMIFGEMTGSNERPSDISMRPALKLFSDASIVELLLPLIRQLEPIRAEALKRALMRVELLHRDGVMVAMPEEIVIR